MTTKYIYRIIIFYFSFTMFLFNVMHSQENNVININFDGKFSGMINNKYKIEAQLTLINGKLSGTYYYTKHKENITLTGIIYEDSNLVINGYDKKGNQIDLFNGKLFSDHRIEGEWMKPAGNNKMPFYLNETKNPIQLTKDNSISKKEINENNTNQDYFPLKQGNFWRYKFIESNNEETWEITMHTTNLNSDFFTLEKKNPVTTLSGANIEEVIETRKDKIVLLAKTCPSIFDKGRTSTENYLPPKILFKYPLNTGDSWNNEVVTRYTTTTETYKVLSLKVFAGEFKNVCQIEVNSITIDNNNEKEKSRKYLYYAPNVGLIKEVWILENDKQFTYLELMGTKLNK